MENQIVTETANILKRLSPQNQIYFMSMVRVAEVAEKSVRKSSRTVVQREILSTHSPQSQTENQCTLYTEN